MKIINQTDDMYTVEIYKRNYDKIIEGLKLIRFGTSTQLEQFLFKSDPSSYTEDVFDAIKYFDNYHDDLVLLVTSELINALMPMD